MASIALNCLVSGDDSDRIFILEVAPSDNVYNLKERVKEKWPHRLANIDAPEIDLFKVSLPIDDELDDKLKSFNVEQEKLRSSVKKMSALFQSVPEEHLHVIAVLPHAGRKRSAPEPAFQTDTFKRTKVATESPSRIATKSAYESLQGRSTERLLDDRPKADYGVPPLPLLYPGFGNFKDDFMNGISARCFVNSVPDFPNVRELVDAVDELAFEMSKFHKDEALQAGCWNCPTEQDTDHGKWWRSISSHPGSHWHRL